MEQAAAQALDGVTIIDFTQVYLGPSATQMLGDFGADVIKIERPGTGDITRTSIPDRDGLDNPIFLAINRNKRSVVIDLRADEGRRVVFDLVERADVVVSNFRAGVMERMGLGYERLREINPRIIWAAATGFGPVGPYRGKGGQDVLAQAYTGVMWRRTDDHLPLSVYATTLCDYTAGMHLCQGILLALLARERTGEGQAVEIAMYDSMLAMQMQEASMQLNRGYELNWGSMPLTGVFPTSDGAVCLVGGFSPDPLHRISIALELDEDLSDREEFATKEKLFAGRSALHAIFAARFLANTTAYWMERMEAQDLLCAPVRTMTEALEDEQTAVNGMISAFDHPVSGRTQTVSTPVHLSATPARVRRVPPLLGEHGAQVLTEHGYPAERIAALRTQGVIL
jgi:crotonobetainyl-CoA:carnitine CoA-transferase CaiB-like acyl-CoA transferase